MGVLGCIEVGVVLYWCRWEYWVYRWEYWVYRWGSEVPGIRRLLCDVRTCPHLPLNAFLSSFLHPIFLPSSHPSYTYLPTYLLHVLPTVQMELPSKRRLSSSQSNYYIMHASFIYTSGHLWNRLQATTSPKGPQQPKQVTSPLPPTPTPLREQK